MPFLSGAHLQAELTMALALLLAWGWDVLVGNKLAWLGASSLLDRLLWPLGCRLRVMPARAAFVGGAVAWVALAVIAGASAWWIQDALLELSPWFAILLLACLFKPMFAWRTLRDEVRTFEHALAEGRLDSARRRLSRVVTRDLRYLGEEGLREAAIGALAKQLNYAVVGPLFWFAVMGLPGAVIYRFANEIAVMWGKRGVWEWAGKWAAHADDALSWFPARITALALFPTWNSLAWRSLRRQVRKTPSPNGGWVMGAMALRLKARLSNPGVYVLNDAGEPPSAVTTAEALRHAQSAAWACVALALLVWLARAV